MYETLNQLYVFLAAVCIGALSAVPYSLTQAVKKPFANVWIARAADFVAVVTGGAVYLLFSFLLKFPSLRAYMLVGAFVGMWLYVKTFHYMLAKTAEIVYNRIRKFVFKKRKRKTTEKAV